MEMTPPRHPPLEEDSAWRPPVRARHVGLPVGAARAELDAGAGRRVDVLLAISQLCFVSATQVPPSTRTSTPASVPPVAATFTSTHHSLPRAFVNVASNEPVVGGGVLPPPEHSVGARLVQR